MITMFDLGDILMILDLDAIAVLLKMWLLLMTVSTTSVEIGILCCGNY